MLFNSLVSKWPLIFFLLVGGVLLLTRLDARLYWGDEREDFNFIWRIFEYGVPYMKGGHTDGTPQVNDQHLHVYHSWLPLYTHALTVKLFGWENRFMFRLPGVLWALVSIWAVWCLARRLGQRGNWATCLYVLSPFMLVPARLSRYYGAVMALSPLVLLSYFDLKEAKSKKEKRKSICLLALWVSLLFHHNMMAALALCLGLMIHWLLTGAANFSGFLWSALIAAVPIFAWLFGMGVMGQSHWLDGSLIPSHSLKATWLLLASFLPFPLLVWLFYSRGRLKDFLLFSICLSLPLFLLVCASSQVTPNLRYFLPLLCLGVCALGFWLESLTKGFRFILFSLLVLTNFLNLIPLGLVNFVPIQNFVAYGASAQDSQRFFVATASPRFLFLGHLAEIFKDYEGPAQTLQKMFVQAGYQSGDSFGLIIPQGEEPVWHRHYLTQALFDLNEGKPGEMLDPIFLEPEQVQWVLVSAGAEIPDKFESEFDYEIVATGDNQLGFWIEGPNPFNRRWQTQRGQKFVLLRNSNILN